MLYDVEWNQWVWNHPNNYQVTGTVSSECDSKFTLEQEAPSVDVTDAYAIVSGDAGKGVYATDTPYTFSCAGQRVPSNATLRHSTPPRLLHTTGVQLCTGKTNPSASNRCSSAAVSIVSTGAQILALILILIYWRGRRLVF